MGRCCRGKFEADKVSMKNPHVLISIPTLNSSYFLEKCLKAIDTQTYKNISVNIVDGGSTDETISIAKKYGVKEIIICKDSLLAARVEGVKKAKSDYVLLLDSDQILKSSTIENLVKMVIKEELAMVILEEDVYQPQTFIEKLFSADRKLIHEVKDFSPFTGVVLPRFYKTIVLKKAMSSIPTKVIKEVGGQDHAIIYYEAWQVSKKVGMLSNAVSHIEPRSYSIMWKKFYRWGKTSAGAHQTKYDTLLKRKERFRTGMFRQNMIVASFASIVLLILKGIPYKLGFYSAKFSKTDEK